MSTPLIDEDHTDAKDISVPEHPPQQRFDEQPGSNKFLTIIANNMHLTTFLPLILIQLLQDINLGLGAILCVVLVLLSLTFSWFLRRRNYLKVVPKKYDIFNLQLYCTVIVLSYTVHRWIHNWISVYINGSNAWFMWATILLPCCDNFVMDSVRDRLPDEAASHPLVKRMALLISITWATALTVMGAAAIVPAAIDIPPEQTPPVVIVCSYVLGLGPLVVAMIMQHVIKAIYVKKIKAGMEARQANQGMA